MFQHLKFKLTLLFTLIAAFLKLVFGVLYMNFEYQHGIIQTVHLLPLFQVMIMEIGAISIVTFVIGYFFIDSIVNTVEDKFNRLEQFTQDASHELRTPLGIANSSLDLAQKTKQYGKYIPEAKSYLKKASLLIERMLDLARLDRHSMNQTHLDARKVVSKTIEGFQPRIKEKKLSITLVGELSIYADCLLFERVVTNLIENAIKYNKEGGQIRVVFNKKHMIVSNTGSSIGPDDLPLIFQRYYQSQISRSDKGYGIGLAMVKQIVDMHGWKISAQSINDETQFDLKF